MSESRFKDLNGEEEKKSDGSSAVLSMSAPWISKENKALEDAFYRKKYRDYYYPHLPQWTQLHGGFCARGGMGGFFIFDSNDKEQPKNQFIEVKTSAGKNLRIAFFLALSDKYFAAVGQDDESCEYVLIFNIAVGYSKSTELMLRRLPPEYKFDDIRITLDPTDPSGFMVIRSCVETGASASYRCHFDAVKNELRAEVIYFNTNVLNLHLKPKVELGDYDRSSSFSFHDISIVGKHYALFSYESHLIITTISSKAELTYFTQREGMGGRFVKFYPLTQNGFLAVKDLLVDEFLFCRRLTYYELQDNSIKETTVANLQAFEVMRTAASGHVFYVSKRQKIDGVTHSTVSVFDPYIKTSYAILVFQGKDIQDLIVTPDYKIGVCYIGKEGPRCDFHPLPELKLKEQVVVEALADWLPQDVAKMVAGYTFFNPRCSKPPLRDLTYCSADFLELLQRIKDHEAKQQQRLSAREKVEEAAEILKALKELRELLTTRDDLDYRLIYITITEKYAKYFSGILSNLWGAFVASYDVYELQLIVSKLHSLSTQPEEKMDSSKIPPPMVVAPAPDLDKVKGYAKQLRDLLKNNYFCSSFYCAPERVYERQVAVDALLALIQNGEKCPTKEELGLFRKAHLGAVKYGSIGFIFDGLKHIAAPAKSASQRHTH